jgi:RND family efflux transporter MFP subunit
LLTVTRTDVVRVVLDLPMNEVRWLDHSDVAILHAIPALPGDEFVGQVTRYSPSLDAVSRMMRVEVDLENQDNRLLPGYYGNVKLRLAELPGTPVIPSSALLSDERVSYVYVVKDGTCRRREVTTNYADGTLVGIEEGLSSGEQIVTTGGSQLFDGQAVEPVLEESP